ncbi:hypothetical protein PUN28_017098 [Cardiocondyla obscurior]|uniref:Secreted protein n=1 Tax=Cardiocondyla obscurior TaxID=286306 RepID=A0AAW2EQ64_9HYME
MGWWWAWGLCKGVHRDVVVMVVGDGGHTSRRSVRGIFCGIATVCGTTPSGLPTPVGTGCTYCQPAAYRSGTDSSPAKTPGRYPGNTD